VKRKPIGELRLALRMRAPRAALRTRPAPSLR